MWSRASSLLRRVLRILGLPFIMLWRFLGRLGLAARNLLEVTWRLLGRLGLAFRDILRWIAEGFWWPISGLVAFLGRPILRLLGWLWRRLRIWGDALRRVLNWLQIKLWQLTRPVLSPVAAGIRWLAPYLWEELGRLGAAARRLAAIATWPLVAPARLLWQRLLGPPTRRLAAWISLRLMVVGRHLRSRWRVAQARRTVRQRDKKLLRYHRSVARQGPARTWARVAGVMAALNLILGALLIHSHLQGDGAANDVSGAELDLNQTIAPLALDVPTATPRPSPIPITPAPPPDRMAAGGSVVFQAREDGNSDILLLSVGSQTPRRLTDHPAEDHDPAWSPDGRRLAFASRRDGNWDLYLLELTTGQVRRLTWRVSYEANPSWSPDGQWLVYESYDQSNLDIYILPVTGGEPIRLTSHPAADFAPSWAPSGRHIAFVSWRSGNPDIHLLALDDARDEAAVNITNSPDLVEDEPSWNPGGDYIAFTSYGEGHPLVYVLPMRNNLPAGQPTVITRGRGPTWAPNGRILMAVHSDGNRHYLLTYNVEGDGASPEVYLSQVPLDSPSWHALPVPTGLLRAEALKGDQVPLFEENVADPAESGPPYTLVELDGIQVTGPFLCDRVDESFQALRQRAQQETGWDVLAALDAMWQPLDAPLSPGVDPESWNKAGRAFDLSQSLNELVNPWIEVVRESGACSGSANCTGTETWWRVYVRTARQDGSQGEPLYTRPWNFEARYSGNVFDYEAGGRTKPDIPQGYYVDLTHLAADYGWQRVPAGDTWRTNFPAIRYWHFEKRQGLAWESALQELYAPKELDQIGIALP